MIGELHPPLVSIIITSYNRADLISKAIESALYQDYKNLEILIIDNSSTDNSDKVISQYDVNYPEIKYIKNETNLGPIPSFLKALKISKGDYFTHVSSDDYLTNTRFVSTAMEPVHLIADPVIICGRVSYLTQKTGIVSPDGSYAMYSTTFYQNKIVEGKDVFLEFTNGNPITMAASIFNREKFLQLDISTTTPHKFDIQVILQILLLGKVVFMDIEAYTVLIHNSNFSLTLQPASESVCNFAFIEVPYQIATSLNSFSSVEQINSWRNSMIENFAFYELKNYYKYDRKEFVIFCNFLFNTYPEIFAKIRQKTSWRLHLIIFKFPSLGNIIIKMKTDILYFYSKNTNKKLF
jgi:glycosyltransferase involved in cell wall biosynthesis